MKDTKSTYCEHCGEFHDPFRDYVSQVKVGELVPDIAFEAYLRGAVMRLSLSQLRGRWVTLVFYPADFSAVSATELAELATLYPEFKKHGAEIIAVSTDSISAHRAWQRHDALLSDVSFPLAADPSGKLSFAFGVLVEGGEPAFTPDEGSALPGTFLIDPTGTLRVMEVSDTAVGRAARETLRKLRAAQYVDTHAGQACPASWEPGTHTLTSAVAP